MKVFPAGLCLLLLCSCATSQKQSAPALPANVHFDKEAGRKAKPIFVKLRMENGEELPFMVDTGSPETFFDKSLEPKLGKCFKVEKMLFGWYGKRTVRLYAAPKLYLGNTPLQTGDWIFTDDLTQMWPGRPMMGILGMDCLRHYCIQLDFATGKMRFLDPDHMGIDGLGRAFPLTLFWGEVSTHMDFFDMKRTHFFLDTADYTDGALQSKLFQLGLEKQSTVWICQGKTPVGTLNRVAYLQQCMLNDETYTNLIFRDCSMGASSSRNIIGLHFLARHLVTLNFPKQTMYLKQTSVESFTDKNNSTNTNTMPAQ